MIRSLLAVAAAVALWVWVAPVLAVEPLTGPHYDKWMILDAEREPMEFTVGYFAACAQERLASVVAGGARPPPGRRVRGEEQDGVFVVTVPGTNEDIVFYFVPAESEADSLVLDRITIGQMVARRAMDKEGAVRALVPNCI